MQQPLCQKMLCFVGPGGVWTIKTNAQARHCPDCFTFNSPPKHRKLTDTRLARAEHKAVVTELLGEEETDSTEAEFLELVTTQDVSIQCGKIT